MPEQISNLQHLSELTKNLCGTRVCEHCGKEFSIIIGQDEELQSLKLELSQVRDELKLMLEALTMAREQCVLLTNECQKLREEATFLKQQLLIKNGE